MSLSLSISKRFWALVQRSRASFHSVPQCNPRTTGEKQKAHTKAALRSSCGSMATGEAHRPIRGSGVSGAERRVMPRSTMLTRAATAGWGERFASGMMAA